MMSLINLVSMGVVCPTDKSPATQAIEDALVIFVYSFLGAMAGIAFASLSVATLYGPFIASALIGVSTYMRARQISPVSTTVEQEGKV